MYCVYVCLNFAFIYVNACISEYVFCVYACMQMFVCRCVRSVYALVMKCTLTMHLSEGNTWPSLQRKCAETMS